MGSINENKSLQELSLEEKLQEIYKLRIECIKIKNIQLEREYYTNNYASIPMGEILQNGSYYDVFEAMKISAKEADSQTLDEMFYMMFEYFLFSSGHDLMFIHKIKADIFCPEPIKSLIYPELEEEIKNKYNNESVSPNNPNLSTNLEEITKTVFHYSEFSSLLFLLYANGWQFPNGWEKLYPESYEFLLNKLNTTKITIGDFLHSLIDYKCDMIRAVLENIPDLELRNIYLQKLNTLQQEKHQETDNFAHVKLPVNYFFNRSFLDFINMAAHPSTQSVTDTPHTRKYPN